MNKAQIQADINNFLDDFLSSSDSRRASRQTRRDDFSNQWYEYEEEYLYNFV